MTVHDDTVDWQTSQLVTLRLANAASGGLASDAIAPDYDPSAGGIADLAAPLLFTGTPNAAVSHVVFNRAGGEWFRRPLAEDGNFNSDGKYQLDTAAISNVLA